MLYFICFKDMNTLLLLICTIVILNEFDKKIFKFSNVWFDADNKLIVVIPML